MEQAFFTRHKLYEAAVRHDGLHGGLIYFTYFRQGNDSFNLSDSSSHLFAVVGSNFYATALLVLINRNDSACFSLDTLNNLTAGANNSTNHIFRDIESSDTRSVRFEVSTRSRHRLENLIKYIHTSLVCLCERIL